jgi:hypothetical protein
MIYAAEDPTTQQALPLRERETDSGRETAKWARVAADIERLARENLEFREANRQLTDQLRDALSRIERLEAQLSTRR